MAHFSRQMESFPRAAPSKRDKEIKVMTALITMSLLSLLFLGPLVWRLWREPPEARPPPRRAEVHAAVKPRLGGEATAAAPAHAGSPARPGTAGGFVAAGGA